MRWIGLIIIALFIFGGPLWGATADDYYNAGNTYFQQKQYEKSIPYYKAVIQMIPAHWMAYEYLAQACYLTGRYEEAYDACQKGLEINSDSKILQDIQTKLGPMMARPPMPEAPSKGKRVHGRVMLEGPPLAPVFWVKASTKYDYSMEGDLNKSVLGWNKASPSAGATEINASAGNSGFGLKLEGGYGIDPKNGMTLAFSLMDLDGFHGRAIGSAVTFTQNIDPWIFGMELDYCRFWPHDDYRFYLKGGLGYYDAFVVVRQVINGSVTGLNYTSTGSNGGGLSNGDFGFNIGAGFELRLEKDLGLELSVAFRYATISNITFSDKLTGGVLELGTLPNGFIGIVDSTTTGGPNGNKVTTLDLTGGEAALSLDYYIF